MAPPQKHLVIPSYELKLLYFDLQFITFILFIIIILGGRGGGGRDSVLVW